MAEKKYRSIDEITHKGKPLREILESHRIWLETKGSAGNKADLQLADLHGADLNSRDLMLANLRRADLSKAELSGANLAGANLRTANLREATLIGTRLVDANLYLADFREAIITRADFSGADKRGVDLTLAIGLESTFGFYRRMKIQAKSATGSREKPLAGYTSFRGSCTISFADSDKEFASHLYASLQANGIRCCHDWEINPLERSPWAEVLSIQQEQVIKLRYGFYDGKRSTLEQVGEYLKVTRERVRQIEAKAFQQLQLNKDKMLVVCSRNSLARWPIIRDIEWGLLREGIERREVLLPLVLEAHVFDNWQHERKADVVAKVVGDFRGWKYHDQYSKNFDKLLNALNRPQADRP